jgi:hypothetical protein
MPLPMDSTERLRWEWPPYQTLRVHLDQGIRFTADHEQRSNWAAPKLLQQPAVPPAMSLDRKL